MLSANHSSPSSLKENILHTFGLYGRLEKHQIPNLPSLIPPIPTDPASLSPSPEEEIAMLVSIQKQLDATKDYSNTLEALWGLKKIFPYLEGPLPEEYLTEVKVLLEKTENLYRQLEASIKARDIPWENIEYTKTLIDEQFGNGVKVVKKTEMEFRFNESSATNYYSGPEDSLVLKLPAYDGVKWPRSAFGEIEYGLYYPKDEYWPRKAVVMKKSIGSRKSGGDLRHEMEREANIWGRLKHENIVEFLGLFKARDVPDNATAAQNDELYLVSPFSHLKILEEHSANLYVSKHRDGLPLIMDNIIDGLHYLHTVEFFRHGNLKGDNVIVFLEDGILSAKLTNFGLSASATEKKLRSTIVGSVTRWTPPEYLQYEEAKELTYAGDVWSLAMTMQELILCAVLQQSEINPFFDIPNKGRDNIFYTFMQDPTESEFDLKMSDYISLLPPCQHNAFPPVLKKNPDLRPTIKAVREEWKAQFNQLLVEWPDFNPHIEEGDTY